MDQKTPDNFGYGNMTADFRKRYKQMLETRKTKEETKKGSKKSKSTKTNIERIADILYGGGNK